MIHQRYRRTDRQATYDSKTALCTIVHRVVKMDFIIIRKTELTDGRYTDCNTFPTKTVDVRYVRLCTAEFEL